MRAGIYRDEHGSLVTREQAATELNLGLVTVTKIAREAGAVVKIGNTMRIDREKLLNYIRANYRAE